MNIVCLILTFLHVPTLMYRTHAKNVNFYIAQDYLSMTILQYLVHTWKLKIITVRRLTNGRMLITEFCTA